MIWYQVFNKSQCNCKEFAPDTKSVLKKSEENFNKENVIKEDFNKEGCGKRLDYLDIDCGEVFGGEQIFCKKCAFQEKEELCVNCGKPSYNHLNKDGVRTGTGIYCDNDSMSQFFPQDKNVLKGCGEYINGATERCGDGNLLCDGCKQADKSEPKEKNK